MDLFLSGFWNTLNLGVFQNLGFKILTTGHVIVTRGMQILFFSIILLFIKIFKLVVYFNFKIIITFRKYFILYKTKI